MRLSARLATGAVATASLVAATSAAPALATSAPQAPQARPDAYVALAGRALSVPAALGVVADDRVSPGGARTVVRHTAPAHGAVDLAADGSFRYTPAAGFHGTDTFTYTMTDAARLYPTHLPPVATVGGVPLTAGYGSSLAPVPGHPDEFYGLTDRGPNVDGPDGVKVEPVPSFTPSIGRFRLTTGLAGTRADLLATIPLRAADGTPYDGQVSTAASTGETIVDDDGRTLPASPEGYDPEGLVAMADGTFWVSDEYGPFITHVSASGRQLERLSPFDGSLPRELADRVPNKGMEGLTLTPDGRTLVGIMQNALATPDGPAKTGSVPLVRIVTVDLRTRATHEYAYLLHDPATTGTGVSEITALSATQFLVDERDGDLEPGADKHLYRIDTRRATDIGPASRVGTYDASEGGVLVGGQSLEALVGGSTTAQATTALTAAGITPVTEADALDVGGLVTQLDPSGGFFGHDKVEGVATTDGGRTVVLSDDSDFGIDGLASTTPPYALHVKTLPDGQQDSTEFLAVDTTRLHGGQAATSTATVTVRVL